MYEPQTGENPREFNKDNLKRFGAELGLDPAQFNECLDSGKYTALVEQEYQLSSQIGVSSTPTFLLNGQPIIGAQPFEAFQEYIETALAQ